MGNAQGRPAAGPVSPVEAAYASAREMLARNRGVLFEDRYTPVRLLGRGSYAEVVECVPKPPAQAPSTSPGLAAALAAAGGGGGPAQQLPPQQSSQRYAAKIIDRGSVKREDVERELAVLLLLADHPACLALHQVFEEPPGAGGTLGPGRWVLVTELCAGGRLFDRLEAEGAFPEVRAAAVLRSLLRFLAYAHEEAGGGELVDPVAWGAGGAAGAAAGGAGGAAGGAGGGGGGRPGAAARLVWTGGCGGGQEGAAAATAVAAGSGQSGGGGSGGPAAGPATRYGPVAAEVAAVTHGAGQASSGGGGVGSSNSDNIRAASVPAPGLSPQSPPAPPPPAPAQPHAQPPPPPAQLPPPPHPPSRPLLLPLGVVHRDLKLENLLLSAEREEMAMIKVIDMGCSTFLPFYDRGASPAAVAPHQAAAGAQLEEPAAVAAGAAAAAATTAVAGGVEGKAPRQPPGAQSGSASSLKAVAGTNAAAAVEAAAAAAVAAVSLSTAQAASSGGGQHAEALSAPAQPPEHHQHQPQQQQSPHGGPRRPLLTDRLGSPHYIAPEVLSGTGYDHAADVWSAGVVAFALLSGRMPSGAGGGGGGGEEAVLRRVREGTIDLSGPAWARVSPAAQRVVAAMLTRDPAQRPSARQLLRQHDWFYEAAAAAGVEQEEGTEVGAEAGAEERTEERAGAGAEEGAAKGTAARVEGQAGLEGGECGG